MGCNTFEKGLPFKAKIIEIGNCTNATDGNAWSDNPQPSYCRVRLEGNIHITLKAPVIKGEEIKLQELLVVNKENNEKKHHKYRILSRR